ncbi:heavy metal-binding domain-containing protein [Asticcacaulis sp. EMRT-3]|uniref:heavy metal-binding domain-containing protein n=1 Tax=Asticcacaulis sp. EMRT-3 TaxID=3040349 RepID=UPI0024AEDB6C|nr:heavy metal-binding domain-containing protein [Asticcacaulis sp. EMRT-3]MDI7775070.1 heavy metal-binding domain-containing protein [Asticcacaulis sp. EMRT-3]
MASVTGLSGNEIYCMALKGFKPGELVVGNSVNSMGFLGSIGAGLNNMLGGEIPQVTQIIQDGRMHAFNRMAAEAETHGASGVAGVSGNLRGLSGNTEFLFVGSCVKGPSGRFFTSAGDAQELYCHMDAGYKPIHHVFGNIAYSMGVGGGILGALKQLARGEISEYSDIFNKTRHKALERISAAAAADGANAVLGIRTTVLPWMGTHEMVMTGTAMHHPGLPSGQVATSDLTGEELWSMASLGYAPVKLLMSTSIYSLGMVGGIFSALKSLARGEISELTTLVHDAREHCIERLKREADSLGAEEVVGVKTYIIEIGQGLIEFMAIGTAVKPTSGMGVATQMLPSQAVVRDRDTWIDGDSGFSLLRQTEAS